VEAAHHGEDFFAGEHLLHTPDDVHDTGVAAGVEDYQPLLRLKDQGLLMAEVIGDEVILPPLENQILGLTTEGRVHRAIGQQPDPLIQRIDAVYLLEALRMALPDLPVDADEIGRRAADGEVAPSRAGAMEDPDLAILPEKFPQPIGCRFL
jgi:hypothetical protein